MLFSMQRSNGRELESKDILCSLGMLEKEAMKKNISLVLSSNISMAKSAAADKEGFLPILTMLRSETKDTVSKVDVCLSMTFVI